MKRAILSMLAVVVAAGLTTAATRGADTNAKGGEAKWTDNYAAALAQAKKDQKMLLLDFTGSDWCGYCIKLHDKVLSTPEFAKWANEKFELVVVDFPHTKAQSADVKKQNEALQAKYKVSGYPTIVILDANEKKLAESVGYGGEPAEKWIAARDAAIAKANK